MAYNSTRTQKSPASKLGGGVATIQSLASKCGARHKISSLCSWRRVYPGEDPWSDHSAELCHLLYPSFTLVCFETVDPQQLKPAHTSSAWQNVEGQKNRLDENVDENVDMCGFGVTERMPKTMAMLLPPTRTNGAISRAATNGAMHSQLASPCAGSGIWISCRARGVGGANEC